MDYIKAIILGLVQGLTEFLPVSSSGHLVILRDILDFTMFEGSVFFELMLHVGSLVPLVFVFWWDLIDILKERDWKLIFHLFIASLPTVVVVFLFMDFIESTMDVSKIQVFMLFTAVVLLFTEWRTTKIRKFDTPFTWKSALLMGCAQSIAVFPGISRSGMTICSGISTGHNKNKVTTFSFFMSMIVISGSAFIEVVSMGSATMDVAWGLVLVGMAAAAISGYFAIAVLLKIIEKSNYKVFAIYLFCLAGITFINSYIYPIF